MVKIYRMWRYLRIAEHELFIRANELQSSQTTTAECGKIFQQKRTILGRKYTLAENFKAAYMADKFNYISLKKGKKDGEDVNFIGISSAGLKFTSFSSLLDALAGTVVNLGTILTVVIAAVALVVSAIALRHR